MRILLTGGTGFIGSALVPALRESGHEPVILSRRAQPGSGDVPVVTDVAAVEAPIEAVINLAGASLADKRWSARYKAELRDSRIATTECLGESLRAAGQHPGLFLSASAVGYYGARGDEPLDEDAAAGSGFAAALCQDWEAAARVAAGDARFCALRLGVVFGRGGGAYGQMAAPFRMRFGNWIGSGQQWLSWIHLQDVVGAIQFLIAHDTLRGPFNLTAPEPTTSRGFCDAMQAVHRSFVKLPVPAAVMRGLLGEMADELLIHGQRVLPRNLQEAGFAFQFPTLAAALAHLESDD